MLANFLRAIKQTTSMTVELTSPDTDGAGWSLTGMTIQTTSNRASSAQIDPFYGTYMFRGEQVASCNGYITIDVSAYVSQIDSGNAAVDFSGAIAADFTDSDFGRFEIIFYDVSMVEISRLTGPNLSPASGQANWTEDNLSGSVPAGTRNIDLYLYGERNQGTNLSIFWDINKCDLVLS